MAHVWKKSVGVVRGVLASAPVRAPASLAPVPNDLFEGGGNTSFHQPIEELVTEMVETFTRLGRGQNAAGLAKKVKGEWYGTMRRAAGTLKQGGARPSAYVRYVCSRLRALNNRFPFPMQVFSLKAIKAWLPEYQRRSASLLRVPTYTTSPERRRAYEMEYLNGRQGPRPVSVSAGVRPSRSPPASR